VSRGLFLMTFGSGLGRAATFGFGAGGFLGGGSGSRVSSISLEDGA